ncbi:hypothetical protein H9635_10240 [Solibacillus sp. A46]|uniref:Uncharacterized protein n=1 Tax=Solibacillus faecavium TaxID=2762221 RepID=A0ABR8XYW4_9BACL|nr:hypothetical protein [Solibacillus faecavium]MBD8037125.1 hypothetical protein [Solibacillus faecavium]
MENHDSQTTLTSYVFYGTKKPLIGATINGKFRKILLTRLYHIVTEKGE